MKKNNPIKIIFILIVIAFISAYYISNSGYYEYELQQRTIITNEKIKEFEEDVKSGNDIDIKKYLDNEKKDYTNKITNAMYNLSEKGNKFTRKCITYIFKKLSYLVED